MIYEIEEYVVIFALSEFEIRKEIILIKSMQEISETSV
jgi:hypothetical protein